MEIKESLSKTGEIITIKHKIIPSNANNKNHDQLWKYLKTVDNKNQKMKIYNAALDGNILFFEDEIIDSNNNQITDRPINPKVYKHNHDIPEIQKNKLLKFKSIVLFSLLLLLSLLIFAGLIIDNQPLDEYAVQAQGVQVA